ncbi:phd-finger domain-containing protein [Cyclospora cayetanensis]|uniref:Inhibitor of growth protein n=1 Tax=Cyclospora cayetanensis TaxID=88456 RepID=A0A1D3D6X1_9EIME|nr:phd-finger domain-containing protein [Cyclospora cayetanensis]
MADPVDQWLEESLSLPARLQRELRLMAQLDAASASIDAEVRQRQEEFIRRLEALKAEGSPLVFEGMEEELKQIHLMVQEAAAAPYGDVEAAIASLRFPAKSWKRNWRSVAGDVAAFIATSCSFALAFKLLDGSSGGSKSARGRLSSSAAVTGGGPPGRQGATDGPPHGAIHSRRGRKEMTSHGGGGESWEGVCPVCLRGEAATEVIKMVACDACNRWFHFECVGATGENYGGSEALVMFYVCRHCVVYLCISLRDTQERPEKMILGTALTAIVGVPHEVSNEALAQAVEAQASRGA